MAHSKKVADLLAQKKKKEEEAAELDKQLQALRQDEAGQVYEQVHALLQDSASFFTLAQRNALVRLINPDAKVPRDRTPKLPPKYQLDNGLTWTGHGKKTNGFDEWAANAAGKKWRAAHPDQRFPAYPNPKAPK
jgi:DNA-binding protein H-NS